ncbi:MAG: hypothetical protein MHPSP_003605, partial [Paramarteilia canceri]
PDQEIYFTKTSSKESGEKPDLYEENEQVTLISGEVTDDSSKNVTIITKNFNVIEIKSNNLMKLELNFPHIDDSVFHY